MPANNSWAVSTNWFVTVGTGTGADVINNKRVAAYTNQAFLKHGKEVLIMESGSVIAVIRTDGQPLGLRWIGVISTADDCSSGSFDWSGSKQDWPNIIFV